MSLFKKILGDPNEKELKKYSAVVAQINGLEKDLKKLDQSGLVQITEKLRSQLVEGETLDDVLPTAFAAVREAAVRTINQRHYDVQLATGIALHQGKIAEMRTGEGKTLAATLPIYLNALSGKGAHLVTVNDYLARRDTAWMGKIYHLLGLSVGCIQHEGGFIFDPQHVASPEDSSFRIDSENLRPVERQEAYAADITYGTNNEFGFDYLRDNMVQHPAQLVQREPNYAIVDEVDSILIDEARTPLIISAPAEEATDQYRKFADIVQKLKEGPDYNIDEKMKASTLTEAGIGKVEKMLGVGNIYQEGGIQLVHHIEQALKATALFKCDRDYVVKEGEIIIVDDFTGRLMQGRRFSEGLHQAIEAKEGVEIKQESKTLATITFQNYFRLYKKLAGMTGTAATEAEEFGKIYNLGVVIIPTNKPMVRDDRPDLIYKNEDAKYKAIAQEIKRRHKAGQPVLIGTISIERNEYLSHLLEQEGVPHQLLNAKQHEKEASIIAQAGKKGAVTVATNMAGRGVDIILGGNPPDPKACEEIKKKGGLCVIGSERHEARRIDNQLRGRAGRQGDPGRSQFYVSLEDDLMRIFGSDRMKTMMERLKIPDDVPIENKMVSKALESAQKRVEGHNFDTRKHLVEYDDVINKHREVVYNKRRAALMAGNKPVGFRSEMVKMIESEIEQVVSFHTAAEDESTWNIKEICEVASAIFPYPKGEWSELEDIRGQAGDRKQDAAARTKIIEYLAQKAHLAYDNLEKQIGDLKMMRKIEIGITLRAIDTLWIDHLEMINYLRTGIGLRGYGQRDPLVEYKKEAYRLFTELMNAIQSNIVNAIYKVALAKEIAPSPIAGARMIEQAPAKEMKEGAGQFSQIKKQKQAEQPREQATEQKAVPQKSIPGAKVTETGKAVLEGGQKVGRNDPCPCGSGKKFKKCHGR